MLLPYTPSSPHGWEQVGLTGRIGVLGPVFLFSVTSCCSIRLFG